MTKQPAQKALTWKCPPQLLTNHADNGLISLPKTFEQSQTIKIKECLIVPSYRWENNVGRLDNALDKNTNDDWLASSGPRLS